MNLLDSARQWLGRRAPAQARRRFEGARADRLTADWQATVSSINEELRADLDRLRSRCRSLVNNNDYARKFRLMVQTNLVGPGGIRLQARVQDGPGRPDRLANAAIEAAWAEWSAACDLAGRPLRDLCETLVGQLPTDGEFIVRMVRGPAAGNRFGFALQAIDADRIDTTYNQAGVAGRNAVIMGVEVDTYRRPVALWVFSAHPNDGIHAARQRERIPMGDLLHCYKAERPEQLRGIPWMAPGVISLYHLGKFSLAALLAAEHGANHYGFFSTPDGVAPVGLDDGGEQISVSQPGTYDVLPPGVSFQQHESKYPDQAFAPFVKAQLQRIASGWGVAYHSLANDLENVNYSSIRSGTLEERDRWASDQEWLIGALLRPVFMQWLQQSLLRGAIVMPNGSPLPAAKMDKFSRHQWQPRRWDWVDPLRDTEANILKVRAGLMSPQDLSAAMGYDFEDTLTAIKQAQDLAQEFGVRLTAYDSTPGATPATPVAAEAPAPAPAPEPARTLDQMVETLARALTPAPAAPAPAPVVQIHCDTRSLTDAADHLADLGAQMRELAADTLQQIREDVQNMPIVIPAPIVNVAAPQVTIENRVEPAAVTLEATLPTPQITVSLPPRRTDTRIERNSVGDIVSTTQLETDL